MTNAELRELKAKMDAGHPLSRSEARDALWTLIDISNRFAAKKQALMPKRWTNVVIDIIEALPPATRIVHTQDVAYKCIATLLKLYERRGMRAS